MSKKLPIAIAQRRYKGINDARCPSVKCSPDAAKVVPIRLAKAGVLV